MLYLLMALVGLAAAWFVAHQDRRPGEMALTFVVASAGIMLVDWIAFGWFALYTYAPHLTSHQQLDCALGELLAEIIFVPSLASLAAARLPELHGAVLSTFAVTAIEALYVRAGLFFHHGWKLWYTALAFPVYFLLVGRVRKRADQVGLADRTLRLVVRIALLFAVVGLYTLALRPFGLVVSSVHILPTQIGNQSLGRFLTYPTVFVPIGYWVLTSERWQRWWRLGAAALAFGLMNIVYMAIHLQHFRPPYTWYIDALGQAAATGLACWCDDLLLERCCPGTAKTVD